MKENAAAAAGSPRGAGMSPGNSSMKSELPAGDTNMATPGETQFPPQATLTSDAQGEYPLCSYDLLLPV